MKNRTKKSVKQKPGPRPTRYDPTRTGGLRRGFGAILRKQFNALKVDVLRFVGDGDAFGRDADVQFALNAFCPTGKGGGIDNSCGARQFSEAQRSRGLDKLAGIPSAEPGYQTFEKEIDQIRMKDAGFKEGKMVLMMQPQSDKHYREVELDPGQVYYTQSSVTRAGVQDKLQGKWDDPQFNTKGLPEAVQHENGDIHLQTGHHRAVAQALATGKVRVRLVKVVSRTKSGKAVYGPPTTNVYCPTGEGGGVDPTCSPGGAGVKAEGILGASPKGLAAQVLGESLHIPITDEVVRSEEIGPRDYDAIEDAMTREEQIAMVEELEETARAAAVDAANDHEINVDAPDRDEVANDIGWDSDRVSQDIAGEIDTVVSDPKVKERLLADLDEWDARGTVADEAIRDFHKEYLHENIWGAHPDVAVLRENLSKMADKAGSAIDTAVDKVISEREYEARSELEDQILSDYDSTHDRREYLRQFYQDNEHRFSSTSTKHGVWGVDHQNDRSFNFKTSDGREFELYATRWGSLGDHEVTEIGFRDQDGDHGVTGKGGAAEVFTKVTSAITALATKQDLPAMYFSASGGRVDERNKSTSRQRLYGRLVKTLAKIMPQYAAITSTDGGVKSYVVVKREHMGMATELIHKQGKTPEVLVNMSGWEEVLPMLDPEWFTPSAWPTINVFCPTGEGGGVDPTCSPGSTGAEWTSKNATMMFMGHMVDFSKYSAKPGSAKLEHHEDVPDHLKPWMDSISEREFNAYGAWGVGELVGFDRAGNEPKGADALVASAFKNMVDRAPESYHGKAYRGMNLPQEEIDNLKVGSTIQTNGLTSFADSKDQALLYATDSPLHDREGVPVLLHGHISNGVELGKMSMGAFNRGDNGDVSEVLLKHGQDLRVTSVEHVDGVVHIGFTHDTKKSLDVPKSQVKEPADYVEQAIVDAAKQLRSKKYRGKLSIGERVAALIYKDTDGEVSMSGAHARDVLAMYGITTNSHTLRISGPLVKTFVDDDPVTANAEEYAFAPDPDKVKLFQTWLEQKFAQHFLNATTEQLWRAYAQEGYRKGFARAFDDTAAKRRVAKRVETGQSEQLNFTRESREEFLRTSFNRPVNVNKVKLLAGRNFDEMKDVTREMSNKMSRALTDGLVQGKGAVSIAKDMTNVVDMGLKRALLISRTELIRAHANGQLAAFKDLGVTHLGVAVEWSTSGFPKCRTLTAKQKKKHPCVCELCEPLEGIVITLEEAHGLIPRHPNCMCAWTPAGLGEKADKQKWGQREIARAIATSISRGVPKYKKAADPNWQDNYDGWGSKTRIGKDRPKGLLRNVLNDTIQSLNGTLGRFDELVRNVFCATGEGGGVDPSCSPGSSSGEGKLSATTTEWLEEWSYANTPGTADKITDDHIREFSSSVPDKPITVWRAAPKSEIAKPPRQGLRSWTTSKDVAEALLEGGDRILLKATFKPHQILMSSDHAPKKTMDEIGSQAEVIVAYGRMRERINRVRSATLNVFCPTGPGGGIDPTCGKGEGGAVKGGMLRASEWKRRGPAGDLALPARLVRHLDPEMHREFNRIRITLRDLNNKGKAGLGHEVDRENEIALRERAREITKIARERRAAAPKSAPKPPKVAAPVEHPAPAADPHAVKQEIDYAKIISDMEMSPVKSKKGLGGGANGSHVLTLESGVKVVWKPKKEENPGLRRNIPDGTYYRREAAAWNVAREIGLHDLVPPTIKRTLNGDRGSVQLFSPNSQNAGNYERVNYSEKSKAYDGDKDLARAAAFDYLLGSTDRHAGNWMVQGDTKLVLIDHGLSFPVKSDRSRFRSWLWDAASQRKLRIPAEVQHWDRDKISQAMKSAGIDSSAREGVYKRLKELQKHAAVGVTFDGVEKPVGAMGEFD